MNGITYIVLLLTAAAIAGDVNVSRRTRHVPDADSTAGESEKTGSLSISSDQNPLGRWESVDFVENVNDFKPEQKSWQGELFLEGVEVMPDGTTSCGDTWKGNLIYAEDGKTKAKFEIREIAGLTYLFYPWLSGDVIEGRVKPSYYVLKRTPGPAKRAAGAFRKGSSHTIRPLERVSDFNDVRWKDMSKLDLTGRNTLIATLRFNQKTIWPMPDKMPPGKDPEKILAHCMNPGLGVRELHRKGITGKGVNVAIIDQPLYDDHPEFAGKIAAYHDVGCGSESSMHGPAVASLLVGTNCGTAPDAKVYYAAAPSWKADSEYYAKALDWIIKQNETLTSSEKIRVVSVSAMPSGQRSPFKKNQQMWDAAYSRAEAAGIMVLDCTSHHGFIWACWYDAKDPENVTKCRSGYPGRADSKKQDGGHILVPSSPRTTAEEYDKGDFSYQYCGRGGLSWSIPYCAGVLAMGWQVRPELTPQQMRNLLFQSAYTTDSGGKIINPRKFINLVKKAK